MPTEKIDDVGGVLAMALTLADLQKIVDEQAEDEGLWFIAETAPEGYLQQELRRLHAAIEELTIANRCPTTDFGSCDKAPSQRPSCRGL